MARLGMRGSAWGVSHATACHVTSTCIPPLRCLLVSDECVTFDATVLYMCSNGLEMCDALWHRASGYLGAHGHAKAGLVTRWEVVGPACAFLVEVLSPMYVGVTAVNVKRMSCSS